MKVAALFAGIGGLEVGFKEAGHQTLLFCEIDSGAQAVLRHQFPKVPIVDDVREMTEFPAGTEIVSAGFPCQDLSQAGKTVGISGNKSGTVTHLFRLLRKHPIPYVVIENVPFMLQLGRGHAIKFLTDQLDALGYMWAYRVIDAQAFGLPQRRARVYLVASLDKHPRNVMFREACPTPKPEYREGVACGFYWTEGVRGLGWAVGGVPTLKGGSTIGIASPPAIWMPDGRIVKPDIRDCERMQGFPADWTQPAEQVTKKGHRWKLVGNAVSVRAAAWVGMCVKDLARSKSCDLPEFEFDPKSKWPVAACGGPGQKQRGIETTTWPIHRPTPELEDFLEFPVELLSFKATHGFLTRLRTSCLRYPPAFLQALEVHEEYMKAKEGENGRRRSRTCSNDGRDQDTRQVRQRLAVSLKE